MCNWEVTDKQSIYNGRIFSMEQRTVRLPNGKEAKRDILLMNGAAGILPVLDDGRILLVRQYREAAKQEILEVPAGMIEPGEEPITCATRELAEETGYAAASVQLLLSFYTGPGYTTEKLYIYLAEGLISSPQKPDDDEFITLEAYELDTAVKMISDGEIVDAKTVAALLYYAGTRVKSTQVS